MSAAPLVSVCIPVRDHAEHLGAAIASALGQDVPDLEVLVHDDASRDATPAVIAAIRDARVRALRHPHPVGVAANRNSCVARARGRYVAWLDADDEYLPGALGRQVAVLEAHPEVGMVHGGFEVVDGDGAPLPSWPAPFERDAIEPSEVAFHHLLASNELATSTVVVRRDLLADAGPFDPQIGPSSTDWDMWLRLALRAGVAYTSRPVARYRQHARTISRATAASGQRLRCDVRVAGRILDGEAQRIARPRAAARTARSALAAKALLHAGDAYTRGRPGDAAEAIELAGRLAEVRAAQALLDATRRGDDLACERLTKAALGELGTRLAGTRFGDRVRRAAARDDAWDRQLAELADAVARVTPGDAVIAAIAKWDPALLARCGRDGCNFPERSLLPGGDPADGEQAVAHLERLRRERGVTHLAVPAACGWWLEHYPELEQHVGPPLWRGDAGAVHDARGRV